MTLPPNRPLRLCSRMISRMKLLGLLSSVIQAILSPLHRRLSTQQGGRSVRILGLLLALVLAVPPMAIAGEAGRNDRAVTVMTRNVYFGADLAPAIGARTVPELIAAATHIF